MRCKLAVTFLLVLATSVNAQQIDYTTTTLDFRNITSTNVDQNVVEQSSNEKLIDFGDWNNDGFIDVSIAVGDGAFGQRRNKLYRNDNGTLVEVSGAPVIPGFSLTDTSRCAFLRDYDNDGWLDIIVINDDNSGTSTNDSPGKTKFFRNINGTTFVNESDRLDNQAGAACNGSVADFDQNGYIDLLMCNYPGPSQESLGLNNINGAGPGQFTVVTETHAMQENDYGVNSEVADMNGDGKLDILVGNLGDPDFIYYNDLNGAGSDIGDFRYPGSAQLISSASGPGYQSLHPSDFNGDGMMDFYYSNIAASGGDLLYINTGNGGDGKATFVTQPMPSSQNGATAKISNPDLDGDGRPDLIVMSQFRRPYIFRNTSGNGETSFIEWTPSIFTGAIDGWHANAADLTGNGRADVLVAADVNEHLFENVDAELAQDSELSGGSVPAFHNMAPIAVTGTLSGGSSQVLTASGVPNGAQVSVLLRSADDMLLEISGSNSATSDRPGNNVDEAVQFTKSGGGDFTVTITNESAIQFLGDSNSDGDVNLLDVGPFVEALSSGSSNLLLDMNQDGEFNLLDVNGFVDALSGGDPIPFEVRYVIEFLSRTN